MKRDLYYAIVEDRNDPLKMGRCRVRVIGIHNTNKNEVPTEALPWSQTLVNANSINIPKENEWVAVYFIDNNTDYPVILGVIPGLILEENEYPEGTPTWPNGTVAQKVDEPTTPRISRGDISNTPTKVSNDDKEHVCNISYELRAEILAARLRVSAAVQWLREQIQKLFSSTSNSAFAQQIQAEIKRLALELKKIQKVIKEINDILLEIAKIVQLIKDLIVWILSLPVRLLAFLQQCLTEFLSSIGSALSGSFGSVTDASGVTVLISDVTNLVQTANQTITEAAAVVATTTQIATNVVDVVNSFEKV
jgi:hypothetical protein